MVKETQKEKINRLENELAEYKRLLDECTSAKNEDIQELKIENDRLNIELAHKICEKNDLKKECEELRARLRTAEHFNDQNNISMLAIRACRQSSRIKELEEEIHKLKNEHVKNERGAGRKPKLIDKKEEIKQLRKEGMKIQELANKYGCSVGKIHKLINE